MSLLPDAALAGRKHSPLNTGIDISPNPCLHYPSAGCTFSVSQPVLSLLLHDLFPYTFAVITPVRNKRLRVKQPGNQIRCCRTIIDFSAGDFKFNWQAITITRQMNLCVIACMAFTNDLRLLTYRSSTLLMRFNIAPINMEVRGWESYYSINTFIIDSAIFQKKINKLQ